MFEQYPDVVGVEELCAMLGRKNKNISKKLAYQLLRQNVIPSIRVGREYRVAKADVIDFIRSPNK
jgi:excisionase family DNA binding protein